MRRIVHPFLAGAIAVLAVHQPMLAALHALGIALTLGGHGYPPGTASPLVAVTAGAAINAAWMAATAWIAAKLAARA